MTALESLNVKSCELVCSSSFANENSQANKIRLVVFLVHV